MPQEKVLHGREGEVPTRQMAQQRTKTGYPPASPLSRNGFHKEGAFAARQHGTGKAGYESVTQALSGIDLAPQIDVREYINDMDVCMAAADLVICRAGAITLSELCCCGKPSVLIPSPYVAENHQYHNAMTLKKAGAAEVLEEKDLTGQSLIDTVSKIIDNKPLLERMGNAARKHAITDANKRIYDVLMQLYTGA